VAEEPTKLTQPTDRVSNAEQNRWQHQAVALLGNLLHLAAKEGLPSISWTVQSAGAYVVGQVLSHPEELRREHFAAWKAAITAASGKAPDRDWEYTLGDTGAQIRLTASWEHLPVALAAGRERVPKRAGVALVASIWPDAYAH
jgi:hypothetical protein